MLEVIGTSYNNSYCNINFLSENKPQRVQADLSEEKHLNAAHPPSNIGIINYIAILSFYLLLLLVLAATVHCSS